MEEKMKTEVTTPNNHTTDYHSIHEIVRSQVHHHYWDLNINCARTTLLVLSDLYNIKVHPQTLQSAIGLHGAGGYRAQCGLVEGGLMFLGIYLTAHSKTEEEIISLCYRYADEFIAHFGSLRCSELRPGGFTETDPPHLCEDLTCRAIAFTYTYINTIK